MNRRIKVFLIKFAGRLVLAVLLSLAVARDALAYELTFEQALDIATTAYQKQFGVSPYGQQELSIARSDGENNVCTGVIASASKSKTKDAIVATLKSHLKDRQYFTVMFWAIDPKIAGRNSCAFVDRISGDAIDFTSF